MTSQINYELKKFLQKEEVNRSEVYVEELINAVAAGPDREAALGNPDLWLTLIGERISPEFKRFLRNALVTAQNNNYGLKEIKDPDCHNKRLIDLQNYLKKVQLTGFIIPLSDEYQSEYVAKHSQRLAWLTGFTGSAGTALVLRNKAAIFVDGRYTIQARNEVNTDLYEIIHLSEISPSSWIKKMMKEKEVLGYDPWLHTVQNIARLQKVCDTVNIKFRATKSNPVDKIWKDQPQQPITPIIHLAKNLTGLTSQEKRKKISEILKRKKIEVFVMTSPDSIAWLANIRGADVPYTPFSLGYAIFYDDCSLDIFNDPRKFTDKVLSKMGSDLNIFPHQNFLPTLSKLGDKKINIGIDYNSTSQIIYETLRRAGSKLSHIDDPCQLEKATKTKVELEGMRKAHIRDGIALAKFLFWIDKYSKSGDLTELNVADKLEGFRREGDKIQGLSFPTISGSGSNGAIVHYRVSEKSSKKLQQNSLYLVDSGAQYIDGTTDVTRTLAIGTTSLEMKKNFTRVLKGHIALAKVIFPEGTSGSQLDVLARSSLWERGLDYDHGTGHGVGSYLSVHEGPQRISKAPNNVELKPGMVISNEPGYYKAGKYGIRIENLVAVRKAKSSLTGLKSDLNNFLCFETLTLAPIDRSLILKSLLNREDIQWLNNYHKTVRNTLQPLVGKELKEWLQKATENI